ncbi:MAG TPA: HAD-IA family hydrolase [Actinomycetota bacterium]|jgi:putative hydrolase of the HAD superfamily|nr:HAD-IA family hydrolase [Actinomycetota bacterium]
MIRAVLWDFGGVISTSPFESFTRYERENGLPADFIRGLNAANHHENAWARMERSEVTLDEFCDLYEAEATAAGHPIDARAVLACLSGDIRPEMVAALRAIKRNGLKQACLTNNFASIQRENGPRPILEIFDVIVESSKVGIRKPEPAFYTTACELLEIEPRQAVMLDDLGVNLKPARELGITTIKVVDPTEALAELERVVGFPVS